MGSITGFDRLLFRGSLLSICHRDGLDKFLGSQGVLYKDWEPFLEQISGRIKAQAQQITKEAGRPFLYLPSAQALLEEWVGRRWAKVLDAWARRVNPWLAPYARPRWRSYYWTVRESEYATDVMFKSEEALGEVYPALCRHAIEQFSAPQVLRFLGRRPTPRFNGEVRSYLERRVEGVCVKHGAEENSIKMYDKQGSVLRVETTLNNPRRFCVRRSGMRKGQRVLAWLPLRKGIADIPRRVQLSRAANERYREALAVVGDSTPWHRILDPVSQRVETPQRCFRALRPISPQDSRVFAVLLRGEYNLQGVRNQDLRRQLFDHQAPDPARPRSLAGRVTRLLLLLPAHGLIYRLAKTYYYRFTEKGREVMNTALRFRETNFALLAPSKAC